MKIYSKNPRCEVYNEHPFVFKPGMQAPQSTLCFDQEKGNLFWLLEPRADSEGVGAALNNPIADSIHSGMRTQLRLWLQELPLKFLNNWLRVDNGEYVITINWPTDYRNIMAERAHLAQKRLLGVVEDGNMKRVNFRRVR